MSTLLKDFKISKSQQSGIKTNLTKLSLNLKFWLNFYTLRNGVKSIISSHSHGNSPSHQPLQQNSHQDFVELQKSQATKGFGFIRSRFHSASSELVNNNNLSQSKTSLANILISPTHNFPSQLKRFSPFFAQNSMNSTTGHHKSLENLDTLDHKTNNFAGSPQHFSHQNRMRPLHSHNKHSILSGRKDEYGLPVSRGCVYLRPEQVSYNYI